MTGKHNRAAIYLRVSRDDQTTGNQRLVLARVAERRGWVIVQTYEDDIGRQPALMVRRGTRPQAACEDHWPQRSNRRVYEIGD